MIGPGATLLTTNLRGWLGARGFWLAFAAALVPLALVGAWFVTHQADVAATQVLWEPDRAVDGDTVEFTGVIRNTGRTGVGKFNATLSVGQVLGRTLVAEATERVVVEGLEPGETRKLNVSWKAISGVYFVLAEADSSDDIGEIEEFNNQKAAPFAVRYRVPGASEGPGAPEDVGGSASAGTVVSLAVEGLGSTPRRPNPNENVTVRATVRNFGDTAVENATATIRVVQAFGTSFFPRTTTTVNVSLPPGGTQEIATSAWQAAPGIHWIEAWVTPGEGTRDAGPADNHGAIVLAIQPRLGPEHESPEPPEKLTIKDFYVKVLGLLHLRILIPFIALFYAGGVLTDEREAGTLPYMLTRPLWRPLLPWTKFVAGFAVSAVALALGIVATFALLFGTPQGNVGFLTTPLLVSLVALFVYGAFFTFLGVIVDRPYLIGVAFVLGWETVAGNFVPWVERLTIHHHLEKAITDWPLDEGLVWLPEDHVAARALLYVMAAGVAFLVLAAVQMRRREFEI